MGAARTSPLFEHGVEPSSHYLHILLRHRLPLQPGGFEGGRPVPVVEDIDHLVVSHLELCVESVNVSAPFSEAKTTFAPPRSSAPRSGATSPIPPRRGLRARWRGPGTGG